MTAPNGLPRKDFRPTPAPQGAFDEVLTAARNRRLRRAALVGSAGSVAVAVAVSAVLLGGGGRHSSANLVIVEPTVTQDATTSPTPAATLEPTATPTPEPSPTAAPYATAFVGVRPVTSTGQLAVGYTITRRLSGFCIPGSDIGKFIYRCFSGNEIHDPCWRAVTDTTVDCLQEPWSHAVIRITVPVLRKNSGPVSSARDGAPWGLTLRDGRRCLGEQGAHSQFNGRAIDFVCGNYDTLILRGLHQGATVWSGDSVTYDKADGSFTAGPTLTIATVWWGEPSA